MKILFCSDFHLNLTNRIEDYSKSMLQILEATKVVDAIYILGDIYHKRQPHPKEQEIFRKWIVQIKCNKFILLGNHDLNLDTHTLNEFEILGGAKIIKTPHILEINNKRIYMGHQLIEGAKLGPGDLDLKVKGATSLNNLLSYKADLYLLGHIHKIQAVKQEPPIIYVGSIERVDFAERNENKYFLILDTEKWKIQYHKLNIRPMQQIDIDLNILQSMPTIEEGAIVKIVVKGTKEQIQKFNEAPLRDALVKSLTYKIIHEIVKENKTRNNQISETKTILDSFTEYSKTKEFNEETTQTGVKLMNEVDSK